MDDSGFQQPFTAPQTPDPILFDRAALLMGRSLYWNTAPHDHVTGIKALLDWCMALPGARLGVAPIGVAQIIQSVYAASAEQPSIEVVGLLDRFGTSARSAMHFYPDREIWREHLDSMLGWLRTALQPNDSIWLDSHEAKWWIESTARSLDAYSRILDASSAKGVLLQLMVRHDCTIFAPFDGPSMGDRFPILLAALPPARQVAFLQLLGDPRFGREQLSRITNTFWTWQPLNFADVDGSVICTPMLGLWNEYPTSHILAPPSPRESAPHLHNTADETVHLLDNVYWQILETLFNAVRQACGLGVAEPEFNDIESRPPVFFFAEPTSPPVLPEAYADSLRMAIRPLVASCLLSNDPLSDPMAWGVLEGDLVALRREVSRRRSFQSRYLLFPTAIASSTAEPMEDKVRSIANQLTFLEFSVGHEARDVFTDMDPLATRGALWGGTLDSVTDIVGEAVTLLPRHSRTSRLRIRDRLAHLRTTLQQVQGRIEGGVSDTNRVEQTFHSYIDGTDDFIRRTITSSSIPEISVRSLGEAIKSAYPYTYLKQPLQALHESMDLLQSNSAHINSSIDKVLEQVDRLEQDRVRRLGILGGVLLTLVAAIGYLPQFVNAQPENTQPYTSTTLPSIIADYVPPQGLHTSARILLLLFGIVLIVSVSMYIYTWLTQSLLRPRDHLIGDTMQFHENVKGSNELVLRAHQFENLAASDLIRGSIFSFPEVTPDVQSAEKAANVAWGQMEQRDEAATKSLSRLWKLLRQLADKSVRGDKQGSHSWERQARTLEHMIDIFDLSPQVIPLPRTLCVLRYKSTEFRSRTTVSDWDFESSLGLVKFSPREARLLDDWLSTLSNAKQIKGWDVATFARVLKERGVSASPDLRHPELWQGSLEGADKPKQALRP